MEKQTCYGPNVVTENLHNTTIGGPYDPNVYGKFANAWFRHYNLVVMAPRGWHFTGEPYVNCIRDDQGAFGWNNFPGAHDRFYVTQRTPNFIQCTCWAGSRSIEINLACEATKDSEVTKDSKEGNDLQEIRNPSTHVQFFSAATYQTLQEYINNFLVTYLDWEIISISHQLFPGGISAVCVFKYIPRT